MIVMSLPVIAAMLLGQTPPQNHDSRCGSYCLYVALEALGYPAMTFEQLEKALGPPSDKGYSMTQLSDHAARVGASTLAVETTVDRLMRRPRPFACIAVMSRGDANHYVLFQDADDTQVHLIDPPRSFTLPLDTFRQSWTGKALLIARAPLMSEESLPPAGGRGWIAYGLGLLLAAAAIALVVIVAKTRKTVSIRPPATPRTLSLIIAAALLFAPGCGGSRADPSVGAQSGEGHGSLVIEPAVHQLGDVFWSPEKTRILQTTTVVRNAGTKPLILRSVLPRCGCTEVGLDRTTLAPGEEAHLTARIKTGDSSETRRTSLVLGSDDPQRPEAEVFFVWREVNPLHAEPPALGEIKLEPHETSDAEFALSAVGITLCEQCTISASSGSPFLSCRVDENKSGRGKNHEAVADSRKEMNLGKVLVQIQDGGDPGSFNERVAVSVRCQSAELARLSVPVAWTVRPIVQLTPPRIFLGKCSPGEVVTRKIAMQPDDSIECNLLGIRCDDPEMMKPVRFERGEKPLREFECEVKTPSSPGPFRVMIHVETDRGDASDLLLPVSGIVSR